MPVLAILVFIFLIVFWFMLSPLFAKIGGWLINLIKNITNNENDNGNKVETQKDKKETEREKKE